MRTNINLPLYHIDHFIFPFIEGSFICKNGKYLDGFFLVDSGSSDNVFNKEAMHLLSEDSIKSDKRHLYAINNEGEECEQANVKIKIGNIECIEPFSISHNLDFKGMFGDNNIIGVLGARFMHLYGLVLDYAQRCVRSSELNDFSGAGKAFVCPMLAGFKTYGIPLVCLTNGEDDVLCVADSGSNINTLTKYAMEKAACSYKHIAGQKSMHTISGESITDLAKVDFSLLSVKGKDNDTICHLVSDSDVFQIITEHEHICWSNDEEIPPISGLISSEFMLRNKWVLDFNVGFIYVDDAA